MEKILQKIIEKIDLGEENSPFLFIDKNLELLNEKIKNLALDLLKHYGIPTPYLYVFEGKNPNKILVWETREFFEKTYSLPPFRIQIFLLEDIWKLTLQASNSLLKIFEEPWVKNIIFLTNTSEANILDTILSRVQTINFLWKSKSKRNEYYQNLLKKYIKREDFELIQYFFGAKLEKFDYLEFLENMIIFSKENFVFIDFLDEILDDILAISQNNVNAKFIVDKWILKI